MDVACAAFCYAEADVMAKWGWLPGSSHRTGLSWVEERDRWRDTALL